MFDTLSSDVLLRGLRRTRRHLRTPGMPEALLRFIRARATAFYRTRRIWIALAAAALLVAALVTVELRTSVVEAWVFSRYAGEATYQVEPGPSDRIWFPSTGPYNERLGYTRLPDLLKTLPGQSYTVSAQARISPRFEQIVDAGLFPIYYEKARAGLRILDRDERPLYNAAYPAYAYAAYDSVPPLVRQTLAFIEDREVLDLSRPYRNPAIEWDRLGKAILLRSEAFTTGRSPGASTLATQLEKMRHSPGGLTTSSREKLRQMASATLRTYLDGPTTAEARHRIVLNYLNTFPLSAAPGHGEVTGLGDGLWAWYGADFATVNRLLGAVNRSADADTAAAAAYRQILSLILATRRPSYYLVQPDGRAALNLLTDRYLSLLATEGVIPHDLRRAAAEIRTPLLDRAPAPAVPAGGKAAATLRTRLLDLTGAGHLYALDRFDLTARTTLDYPVQQAVSDVLARLNDPDYVRAAGLVGANLLGAGDPAAVTYAVVLYEIGPDGNAVRVQADNFDGPFNLNERAKLELGSTAKLRTLVNYLEVVEALHAEFTRPTVAPLRTAAPPSDRLTVWALDYLRRRPDASAAEMLEAAMARRYSASPAERFYTGGGTHVFRNFSSADDSLHLTVQTAFRQSVNLVFVRMMRDIVDYHTQRLPGNPATALKDRNDPRREALLTRFAVQESRQYLNRYYPRYAGKDREALLETFVQAHTFSTEGLARVYRILQPDADTTAFYAFLDAHRPDAGLSDARRHALFTRTDASGMSWADRGYLTKVHPLELWAASYLMNHPTASRNDLLTAVEPVVPDVYGWLFKTRDRNGQDLRIRTILEQDAFVEIHTSWKRLGYPFETLIPSYATSIGSSADRPDALAELVGILLRDGERYPTIRLRELQTGEGTPYETTWRYQPAAPRRVLSADLAATVRTAMIDVVERGTARRAAGAIPTTDGTPVAVGGKTGTGDNRIQTVGPNGQRLAARALNRTSTFVFFLGDRFYGTITAYVPGPEAAGYRFTSSLPTQLLKVLGPSLTPLFESPDTPLLPVPAAD